VTVRDVSPGPTHLRLEVDVPAPADRTWAAVTDWDRQGEWMLGTSVRATDQDGKGVGGGLRAVTGIGRVGVVDTMVITEWDPPRIARVRHTGRLVRGDAAFEVRTEPIPEQPELEGSVFVWSEELDLPLGAVGRLGWRVVRPAFLWGLRRSLERFAAFVTHPDH
jgi:Polyketide cyclase / dehydrase and lipid transport